MPISICVWNKMGIREITVKGTKIIIQRHNRAKLESWKVGRENLESLISGCGPLSQLHVPPSVLTPSGASPLASQTTRQAGEWLHLGEKLQGIFVVKRDGSWCSYAAALFSNEHEVFLKVISLPRAFFHIMSLPWEMLKRDGSSPGLRPAAERGAPLLPSTTPSLAMKEEKQIPTLALKCFNVLIIWKF